MAVAKKSKKSSDKVNDVSRPGETPASSNARPTITGHNTDIKSDPMVAFSSRSESVDEDTETDKKRSYINKSKIKISPISEDDKDNKNKDDENSDEKEIIKDKTNEKTKDESDEKTEEKTEEDKPTDEPEGKTAEVGSDSAAIDAIAQTADAKKAESKQEEENKKHKELVDGLMKNGKYRLPIVEGGHKGSAERFVSWIFLLLLLASVAVYLSIDAGYIDIGFDLPFEFIKN